MSKYLGTLNVDAGDAGTISLEISTATPLERIAAVPRFADDMTTGKPDVVDLEVAVCPDPPPARQETEGRARVQAEAFGNNSCRRRPRCRVRRVRQEVQRDDRPRSASPEIARHRWSVQRGRQRAAPGPGGAGAGVWARRRVAPLQRLRLQRPGNGLRRCHLGAHPQGTQTPGVVAREVAAHASRRRRRGGVAA